MYRLRYSKASPYVRKVVLAAHYLQLQDEIEFVEADTNNPADSLRQENPTGRIPVLLKPDNSAVYDSRVILDFLERQSQFELFPQTGDARDVVLTRAALAESLIDSAILWVYAARYAGDAQPPELWRSRQQDKLQSGLNQLEAEINDWASPTPNAGALITLTACLGYLSFRQVIAWQEGRPNLVKWYENIASNLPGFSASAPGAI